MQFAQQRIEKSYFETEKVFYTFSNSPMDSFQACSEPEILVNVNDVGF